MAYFGFRDSEGRPKGPNGKQKLFLDEFAKPDSAYKYFLLHGGSRGGKTSAAMQATVRHAFQNPGLITLLGHFDLMSLDQSLLFHLQQQIPEKITLRGRDRKILYHEKQKRRFIVHHPDYLHPARDYTACYYYWPLDPTKRLDSRLRNSGLSCGIILLDQIELITPAVYRNTLTRLSEPPSKVIVTANPVEDAWYLKLWCEFRGVKPADRKKYFELLMNPADNAENIVRDYVETLRSNLSEALQERFIEGKYGVIDAKVLEDFDEQRHIIEPIDVVPSDWQIWVVIDYGIRDPAVANYWGIDTHGRATLIDSLTIRNAEPNQVAAAFLTQLDSLIHRGHPSGQPTPQLRLTIGDPSMFGRDSTSMKSVAMMLRDYVHPNGWRLMITPASTKGLPQKRIVFTQAVMLTSMFRRDLVRICRNNYEWIAQSRYWTWGPDEKPKDSRSLNPDGSVEHHFDHMACARYFATEYMRRVRPDLFSDMVVSAGGIDERDYGFRTAPKDDDSFDIHELLSPFSYDASY